MQLEFHQVDAFTSQRFAGNPAMVYRLESWLPEATMQRIAAEHNLAETAFLVREGKVWHIRWFTPTTEVPLCGHATLAAAFVLYQEYGETREQLTFTSKSGALSVTREDERLWLDFPSLPPSEQLGVTLDVERALGVAAVDVLGAAELFVLLESEAAVKNCTPDMTALARLPWPGVIVTARGEQHDFVSRYFAPAIGIPEDAVTGSTHCSLIPYWSKRLSKTRMTARQCSARGGELLCRLEGDRVQIGGHAVMVASGHLWV